MPFEFLDRGLRQTLTSPLPILDLREIAAEKIAAFWRRRQGARFVLIFWNTLGASCRPTSMDPASPHWQP